jgi:hypothetical protein
VTASTGGRSSRARGARRSPEFKKADIDARQELYRKISEQIWKPERLYEEAGLGGSINGRPESTVDEPAAAVAPE